MQGCLNPVWASLHSTEPGPHPGLERPSRTGEAGRCRGWLAVAAERLGTSEPCSVGRHRQQRDQCPDPVSREGCKGHSDQDQEDLHSMRILPRPTSPGTDAPFAGTSESRMALVSGWTRRELRDCFASSTVSRRRPRTCAPYPASRGTSGLSSCHTRGNADGRSAPRRCAPTDGRWATARSSASGNASHLEGTTLAPPQQRICGERLSARCAEFDSRSSRVASGTIVTVKRSLLGRGVASVRSEEDRATAALHRAEADRDRLAPRGHPRAEGVRPERRRLLLGRSHQHVALRESAAALAGTRPRALACGRPGATGTTLLRSRVHAHRSRRR